MLDLFDILAVDGTGKKTKMHLEVFEDNQATIQIVKTGYSQKMRDHELVQNNNLGSMQEMFDRPEFSIEYADTTIRLRIFSQRP